MPMLWNRTVASYRVDVFHSSTLNYTRSLRLQLAPTADSPAHTVSIQFPSAIDVDNINIGSTFTTISMPLSRFDALYHVLQTESPVFFTAYEFDAVRFIGITTDPEATGEGFHDPNA